MTQALDDLSSLPFPRQREFIEGSIGDPGNAASVLQTTAALPDPEPFCFTIVTLSQRRLLDAPEVRRTLGEVFPTLTDTAIQRLLRTLSRTQVDESQVEVVAGCAERALETFSIDRIAALCLMHRWLRNTRPERHADMCRAAASQVDAVTDEPRDVADAVLIRLPGRRLTALARTAVWRERLRSLADRVLDVLEHAPKSLSQANAEEILAHQVYTDPGHFLFELLQNAEDAHARRWCVDIEARQVNVWHDGDDFDVRDVVGILSIGQTTKSKEQIGFFGVGFKSVYEVCDRPQVYSGLFDLEIADVSVPRKLAGRPEGSPPEGTLLVLPLREPLHADRSPAALYRYASRVPAEMLLTLAHLRRIEARHDESTRAAWRREGSAPGRVELVDEVTEAGTTAARVSAYLVESGRFAYDGPRDTSRAASSPVLVAVALDALGRPTPITSGPTVFSYLPTGERSRLPFLVHAHFDLPVDRERLDLSSPWNTWALSRAGDLLARIGRRLAEEYRSSGADPEAAARLRGFLDVVPLESDLGRPEYRILLDAVRAATDGVAFLVGRSGNLLRSDQAAVVWDERLLDHLADVPLDPSGRRALAALSPREALSAVSFGARPFGPADLVDLVARASRACADSPPTWIASAAPVILDCLGTADIDVGRLRGIAWLPDQLGRLQRPEVLGVADPRLREVYGNLRPLLAADIDDGPSSARRTLLGRLGVRKLRGEDLVHDIDRPEIAQALSAPDRIIHLLEYLEDLPVTLTRDLGRLPIFPDERGARSPLCPTDAGTDPPWLAPCGEMGELLRSVTSRTLRFVASDVQERFGAFLVRLGARELDIEALVDAVAVGKITLDDTALAAVHDALDLRRDDLSPRLCHLIRRAPLFRCSDGRLRPLEGPPSRARLPADAQVRELLPGTPWVAPEVAARAFVAMLGVEPVGPASIVRSLLLEDVDDQLVDPFDAEQLERAYAYLAARGSEVPSRLLQRLAEAPIWLDARGLPRALADLRRRPTSPRLSALYDVWDRFPIVKEGPGSTFELASALGLDARIGVTDHSTLIRDLIREGATGIDPVHRPLLVAALDEASARVRRSDLEALSSARIFRAMDGRLLALGPWSSAIEDSTCFRAPGPTREALSMGSRALLSLEDEHDLEPVLRAMGVPIAGIEEVVAALEQDPSMARREAADSARSVLAALARETALAFAPDPGSGCHPRLQALAIWPTTDGRRLPASGVVRRDELERALPGQWAVLAADSEEHVPLLSPDAVEDADALRGLVSFQSPATLVVSLVERSAREGEPLTLQTSLLGDLERLTRLLALVHGHLGRAEATLALPLVVDRAGKLRRGRHHAVTAAEVDLFGDLDGLPPLADPAWSRRAAVLDPDLAPRLPARRILAALGEISRDAVPAAAHRVLHDPAARARFHRWLVERSAEIGEDANAKGELGRANVIPDVGQVLRAPRDLLLDSSLPDLGLGWGVASELPPELVAWLQRLYQLDESRLEQIVNHVLEGHRDAAARRDVSRSCELLSFLARALRSQAPSGNLESLARRFRLHRQLKVARIDAQEFERPGRLMLPARDRWELVEAFLLEPPPRVAPAYEDDELVLRLLVAAGARTDLDAESLAALHRTREGLRPGRAADVAYARYVAVRALEDATLRSTLHLDDTAWIPNGNGDITPPWYLFWPHEDVTAILGHRPSLLPDPELVHTVPQRIGTWLAFNRADDISLDEVAQRLASERHPAPPAILDWLERGLDTKRLKPADVRARLDDVAVFEDGAGLLRPPRELVRRDDVQLFGGRRGSWPGAERYPRLASALRISRAVRAPDILEYLEEVAADLDAAGGDRLADDEPLLAPALTRCLGWLAVDREHTPPRRLPLACLDPNDAVVLKLSTDPLVALPPDPTDGPVEHEGQWFFPVLPHDAYEAAETYLARLGVRKDFQELSHSISTPPTDRSGTPTRGQEIHIEKPREKSLEEGGWRGSDLSSERSLPRQPPGLLDRMKRWLRGSEPPPPEPRPGRQGHSSGRRRRDDAEPLDLDGRSGARRHEDWFKPRDSVDSQLHAARAWLRDRERPPSYGLSFGPPRLPLPWTYGVQLISPRFDHRAQTWTSEDLDPTWAAPRGEGRDVVRLRGRVPAGDVVLPVPLYGRVIELDTNPPARHVRTRQGRSLLVTAGPTELRYTVVLDLAPEYDRGTGELRGECPASMLTSTVPDSDLPDEVHEVLARLESEDAPPFERALEVRRFIRERYRYDPAYLEDEGVARWLREVSSGRANAHVAALHAGGDERVLGRGVCFELNVLACELLRRLDVPAAVAVGWTFSDGSLAEPDHLWAMALLPTPDGPRWLPIDAASTNDGRPLRLPARPPGPWRVESRGRPPLEPPAWDRAEPARKKRKLDGVPTAPDGELHRGKGKLVRPPVLPVAEVVTLIRRLEELAGVEPSSARTLRKRALSVLHDPDKVRELLGLFG